jgi:hypothetical protein
MGSGTIFNTGIIRMMKEANQKNSGLDDFTKNASAITANSSGSQYTTAPNEGDSRG